MQFSTLALSAILAVLAKADTHPEIQGMRTVWADEFFGTDLSGWNIITGYLGVNSEAEVYAAENVKLTGSSLHLTPLNNGGKWTSGRIEAKQTVTPQPGKATRIEGRLSKRPSRFSDEESCCRATSAGRRRRRRCERRRGNPPSSGLARAIDWPD